MIAPARAAILSVAGVALWSGSVMAEVPAAGAAEFTAVPKVPGAFQIAGGPRVLQAKGKPLTGADLPALAGKAGGFDIQVAGLSLFGMAYAHRLGRREPFRPLPANLSDWSKAPACPPDRVLIDPATGRLRFFAGNDPATFKSEVMARFRGTHGDLAITHWRGNTLFISHWEASFHVWAYDLADPASPVKVGELAVGNYAHGFVVLDSGWGLMGTTGDFVGETGRREKNGIFLLDLRDPRKMKVVKQVLSQHDWVDRITPRYVAVWRERNRKRDDKEGPRVFDTAKLPGDFPEVTAQVPPAVQRYLASRVSSIGPDSKAWFRQGDQSIASIDLKGEPANWRVVQTISLPKLPAAKENSGTRIRLQMLAPAKRLVLLCPGEKGKKRLQVLDLTDQGKFLPPVEVEETASQLSIYREKYVYVSVLPKNRGGGVIGTWPGTHLDVYDLSNPASIQKVGSWDPGFPTRDMQLIAQPGKENIVLIKEESTGMGFHCADLVDPVRPKVLASVATNGEGNRVAVWGDRAIYTSSTLATWFDLADPMAPKPKSTWFNHQWFWVRHLHDQRAVISMDGQSTALDFSNPAKPRQLPADVPADAAWGTRLYGVKGGPRSGSGPLRLTVADMADPARLIKLSEIQFPAKELDVPKVVGLWADGPLLYGVTEGEKGKAVFLIWDVSDPKKPAVIGQLRHPELEVQRGAWFWTAQGHVLAAANGIAVITSYASGPPQVIDARNPRQPKFLMRLPYKGKQAHHGNEMTDCRPDGRWFYIKSYPDPVQLWDFTNPEAPRQIWEETGKGPYGAYSWQAGVPAGPVLLIPQLSELKVLTVPRPSQTPMGKLTWR